MMESKNGKWLILFLLLCILTPLSNDIFLPSLPSMMKIFASVHVKYIVSVFMLGLALGQVICGPLSDRYGRKPVLLSCLSIYSLATVALLIVNSLNILLALRFIQALACSAMIPGVMAIAKDSFARDKLIIVIPLVLGAITVMPIIAPILGSFLQLDFGWRASFFVLLMTGVFFLFVYALFFKESIQEKNLSAVNPRIMLKNYKMLITHRAYISYALSGAFCYGLLFAYLAASPFIFMREFHLSIKGYTLCFILFALVVATGSFLIPLISKIMAPSKIILMGAGITVVGCLILLITNILISPSVLTVLLPMIIVSIGVSLIRPCAGTLCLQIFPAKYAGTSSAFFNLVSFTAGFITTGIIAIMHTNAISFSILILILACLSTLMTINAAKQPVSMY